MANGTADDGKLASAGKQRLGSHVQVLVGVGSLLALLAVAVGLAVVLIVSFEDEATNDTQRDVLYATAIHEAALSAKSIANHQRGFLLSGDQEFLDEIRVETDVGRSAFIAAASYASTASQREAVRESRAGFERWVEVVNALAASALETQKGRQPDSEPGT